MVEAAVEVEVEERRPWASGLWLSGLASGPSQAYRNHPAANLVETS